MPPLISLLLPVKNGLPHLTATIEAVRRQTYRNYELIVQDGGSTDGTLDYLHSLRGITNVAIASEYDRGIGQAYNRALARSVGDLLCFLAADEYLEDDSLERGVGWFNQHPNAVIVNGAVRLTNANDEAIQTFEAPPFDLLGHLRCEVVLPFAGLLNRQRIGQDLFYDESLQTCPDYDFWIRVGSRIDAGDFISMKEVFKTAKADRTSMSFKAESFGQFCRDKLFVLNRYLASRPPGAEVDAIRRSATAGIYLWAAESVFFLEGLSQSFLKWCQAAAYAEPSSPRLHRLARRSGAFSVDTNTGRITLSRNASQPATPPCESVGVPDCIEVGRIRTDPHWNASIVEYDRAFVIRTAEGPWEYAAEIPLLFNGNLDERLWYWARLDLLVRAGQIGVALRVDTDIAHEQIVSRDQRRKVVFVVVSADHGDGIIIRNGGMRQSSTVELLSISIHTCPRPL